MTPKKEPTEESVLAALERGPIRPAAMNAWHAGTDAIQQDLRTRAALDRLVEKGLAVKKAGGWYRLSEAGRNARSKS